MKNKEKYAKEIVEIACSGDALAVSKVTGKPISCRKISCEHCNCYNDFLCEEKRLREWAESECIKKPVISKRDRAFLEYLNVNIGYINVTAGQVYRHFKGQTVKVLHISQDTEAPGQFYVVYECEDGAIWSRPYGMFVSEVDHVKYPNVKQKYRFELVGEDDAN